MKKTHIMFAVAIIIGSIGAIGQAYMLYHELASSYPYKMMDYKLYEKIATVGIYLSPIIAIIGGITFGLKRFWLALIFPVMTSPFSFAIIFKIVSIFHSSGTEFGFDGMTPANAAQEFYMYSASLAFVGLIIGLICSCILFLLSKEKKLP